MHYSIVNSSTSEEIGQICRIQDRSSHLYLSPKRFILKGFTLSCICKTDPKRCQLNTLGNYGTVSHLLLHVKYIFYFFYPLGAIIIALNLAVILMTIISSLLRNSVTMNLIFNMAVCDLIIGFFSVFTARLNVFPENETEAAQIGFFPWILKLETFKSKCDYLTFLFGTAQFSSVMTSFFLTMERYIAIVYCMKPNVRMTRRVVYICVVAMWIVSAVYNVGTLLYSYSRKVKAPELLFCANTNIMVTRLVSVSALFGIFYVVVLLSTIPLYAKMYIFIKNTTARAGVKRESSTARKMAALVLTNFLLMIVPISFVPISSRLSDLYLTITTAKQVATFKEKATLISILWLPLFLLSLNSCLNPILFAFRHPLFQAEVKKFFKTKFHTKPFSKHNKRVSSATKATITDKKTREVFVTKL